MSKKELINDVDLDEAIEAELTDVTNPNRKKKKVNYVDPKKLREELHEYASTYREAKANGKPTPKMSNYLGEAIILIATNTAKRPNFSDYPYKEEMIGDAIENVLRYVHNYNSEKFKNAFGYISKLVWNAFLGTIEIEKGEYARKLKRMYQYGVIEDAFDVQDQDEDGEFINSYIEFMRDGNDFLENYERKREEKRKKRQKTKAASKDENSLFEDE